jgi:hypothetical protein
MEQLQTRKNKPHTRPKRRVITHTIGPWAWNQDNLKSKIVEADSELSCYGWKGSTGPETHLFGGFKNGVSQMNQARRLYWMGEYNEDIADKRITMTCKNTHCMNIAHMKLAPNLKLFKDDGITPAQPQRKRAKREIVEQVIPQPEVKTTKRKSKQAPIIVYNKELEKW